MANVLVLCPPSVKNHCLNGGTCYMTHNNTKDKICRCLDEFFGPSCGLINYSGYAKLRQYVRDFTENFSESFITYGISISLVLFFVFVIVMCSLWYAMNKRRKRDHLLWRQNATSSKECKFVQVNTTPAACNDSNTHNFIQEQQQQQQPAPVTVDRANNTSPIPSDSLKINTFNHSEPLPPLSNQSEVLETYDNVPMMELNHVPDYYRRVSTPLSLPRNALSYNSSPHNTSAMISRRSNSNILGFDILPTNMNHRGPIVEPTLVHSYMNPMNQIPISHNSLPKVWMDNRPILKVASEHDALLHDLRERGSNHSYY